MRFTIHFLAAVPLALSLGLPLAVHAADPYVDAMREEGRKLERADKVREEIRADEHAERQRPAGKSALTQAEFEGLLRRDGAESYTLYGQLNAQKRGKVFESYRVSGKMSDAKRRIIDFYLGL